MSLLSRDELLKLLEEISTELESRGLRGHLFVVGGAAMALAYNLRRSTRDLGAVFEPKDVVYQAARDVGKRHGLAPDWLNDAVKGFLPGEDPNATTLFDRPGLSVRIASPRYLFAMKAAAARIERDARDLLQLYALCGFSSVEEALDCVEEYYPAHLLPPKTAFLLRELLS
ncbi:DUF6036 family nucleotidyltransferase [Longispora albida]|uniref:DUF6036 family nucleotidyltransferase n=1 Tax=Longispora albida TaxID=203523 RepID=UPI00037DF2D6|nr:DUF6036 family nucleotidyltransferase [Longispora albida]